MNRPLLLSARTEPPVRLRAVGPQDLEDLRVWKNSNKAGFFFKDDIMPEMQLRWYEKYSARANDYMFIVEHGAGKAGCMGFRLLDDGTADTYNMISAPAAKGKGLMKAAMLVMCSYVFEQHAKTIVCLVIKSNPAVHYYEHCGYAITGDGGDHHIMTLDRLKFKPVPYDVSMEMI
ncbi:MAG: GNAT family N-acetyltransferase [Elusimicrobiota bacterium]